MKKFYLISCACRSYKSGSFSVSNYTSDINPIDWVLDCNVKYHKEEEYALINFWEITEEQYKNLQDFV